MPVKWIIHFFLLGGGLAPAWLLASTCHEDANYQYANQLREQGAYTDALAVYDSVLVRDPACMAAKIEMGFCYLYLGDYGQASQLLNDARQASLQETDDPEAAANVRALIDAQLEQIPQLRQRARIEGDSIQIQAGSAGKAPRAQLSVGVGVSDNINGGVQFDELTFGTGDAVITQKLGEQSKAQDGEWLDLEAAWQGDVPVTDEMPGQLYLAASWRDIPGGTESDLGTLRGGLELKPAGILPELNPKVVVSGGSFILDGREYRDDLAVGARISPEIRGHKFTLGYQFAHHNYRTINETDGRYHRLSLALPLLPETGLMKTRLGLDLGYQWPEAAERLGDYYETSAKLRLGVEPVPRLSVSASYGVSQQRDAEPYNPEFFGDAKRNLDQEVLDIGWAMAVSKDLSLEANLQYRQRESEVKLFEHNATDLTAGIRWQLD